MTENLSVYFDGTPHTITLGEVTKPCLFVEGDDTTLAQGGTPQIMSQAVATVITADFPTIKGNDAVVITTTHNGVPSTRNFKVWRRLRIMDGALTEILLKVAA